MMIKICCKYNHVHLLEILISGYKAAVNDKNPSNYWTPLHVAAFNNSADIVSVSFVYRGYFVVLNALSILKIKWFFCNHLLFSYIYLKIVFSESVWSQSLAR